MLTVAQAVRGLLAELRSTSPRAHVMAAGSSSRLACADHSSCWSPSKSKRGRPDLGPLDAIAQGVGVGMQHEVPYRDGVLGEA